LSGKPSAAATKPIPRQKTPGAVPSTATPENGKIAMNTALAGLVLLVIGDSHIAGDGRFNNSLHEALVDQGATVHTFGVCGSVPSNWMIPSHIVCGRGERHNRDHVQLSMNQTLLGWSLPALISNYHPNIVLIELGDNLGQYSLGTSLSRDWITSEVNELLLAVRSTNVPCVWIGPTWGTENGPYNKTFAKVKGLSDMLSQIVAPCHYVDSLAFSQPGEWRTLDGVHLTSASNQLWAKDLVKSIGHIALMLTHRSVAASVLEK